MNIKDVKMRKIISICTLMLAMTGCSQALIDKLSTESYRGREAAPFVTEHPVGVDNGRLGILKRLIVTNPLSVDIDVNISCSSMFMDDPEMHVKAHTSKFMLISANHSQEHSQSCWLMSFTVSR